MALSACHSGGRVHLHSTGIELEPRTRCDGQPSSLMLGEMRVLMVGLLLIACSSSPPSPKSPAPAPTTRAAAPSASRSRYDWLPDKPLLVVAVRFDERVRARLQAFLPFGDTPCGRTISTSMSEIVVL